MSGHGFVLVFLALDLLDFLNPGVGSVISAGRFSALSSSYAATATLSFPYRTSHPVLFVS